jgi:hypothetical protein
MTLNVNYTTDLEVRSERTQIDRAFFNRRFKALYDELARLDTDFMGFGATENTLVQLGLERINETLGPALATLQAAGELGFLTCRVIGENHSLVGGEFIGWHVTEGAELFTPTHFLLALDENDYTNWGILSVDPDGWHATTGELSTHVVYANLTPPVTSSSWQIAAHAGVLPAMQDMLVDANAAKTAAQASQAQVAADMVTVQGLINAVQAGPVASVAGKTGAVTLVEGDIAGLVTDLAAKATIAYVGSQVAGKQNSSAKLDALVNLAWATNKLIYATGGATLATLDISDFMKTHLDDADASTALSTLGISAFVKTMLDDADAAAVRTTLGVAAAPDLPVKATSAEIATGTDDVKFATALGIATTYLPKTAGINTQTGTTYTLVAADNSKIIRFTSAMAVTCNLPASIAIGFNAMIEQFGAGQVTINVVTNATRRSFGSKFKLAGQYATASVFVELNSDGAHAEWNVSGNLVV